MATSDGIKKLFIFHLLVFLLSFVVYVWTGNFKREKSKFCTLLPSIVVGVWKEKTLQTAEDVPFDTKQNFLTSRDVFYKMLTTYYIEEESQKGIKKEIHIIRHSGNRYNNTNTNHNNNNKKGKQYTVFLKRDEVSSFRMKTVGGRKIDISVHYLRF